MNTFPQQFKRETIVGIAAILGDTRLGLTNPEISHIGQQSGLPRIASRTGYSKKNRLFDMFAASQNKRGNNQTIVNFILLSATPGRFLDKEDEFEWLRNQMNRVLAFEGIALSESGKFIPVLRANTIRDADARARERPIRSSLSRRPP